MEGSASDGMDENDPDEACDHAPEAMHDACVALDSMCTVDREARAKDDATMVFSRPTLVIVGQGRSKLQDTSNEAQSQ